MESFQTTGILLLILSHLQNFDSQVSEDFNSIRFNQCVTITIPISKWMNELLVILLIYFILLSINQNCMNYLCLLYVFKCCSVNHDMQKQIWLSKVIVMDIISPKIAPGNKSVFSRRVDQFSLCQSTHFFDFRDNFWENGGKRIFPIF